MGSLREAQSLKKSCVQHTQNNKKHSMQQVQAEKVQQLDCQIRAQQNELDSMQQKAQKAKSEAAELWAKLLAMKESHQRELDEIKQRSMLVSNTSDQQDLQNALGMARELQHSLDAAETQLEKSKDLL